VSLNSRSYEAVHRRLAVEEATAAVKSGDGLQGVSMRDSEEEEGEGEGEGGRRRTEATPPPPPSGPSSLTEGLDWLRTNARAPPPQPLTCGTGSPALRQPYRDVTQR